MSEVIEADFEILEASRDQLIEAVRDMQATADGLRGQVELVLTQWEGEAAGAYETAQSDWMRDSDLSRADLLSMIRTLTHVIENYRRVERQIVDLTS